MYFLKINLIYLYVLGFRMPENMQTIKSACSTKPHNLIVSDFNHYIIVLAIKWSYLSVNSDSFSKMDISFTSIYD